MKENLISLRVISILLLIFAVADLPYRYYLIMRWYVFVVSILSMVHFSWYEETNYQRIFWMTVFILSALIFNPIIPFNFEKDVWIVIDISAAALFPS